MRMGLELEPSRLPCALHHPCKARCGERCPAFAGQDINITARYGQTPVIDSFQYFDGLPSKETVAQLIDTILVPDESEAQWVADFVAGHAGYFGANSPKVIAFPVGR